VFRAEAKNYPLPSGTKILSGDTSISTGLSRSFSAIVRFNFREARSYNPYGLRIFSFFFIQFFLRLAAIFIARHPITSQQRRLIIGTDILLSALLFVVFFWPFIANMVETVNNFLFFQVVR
jgi:hypothetical protein